MKGDWQDDVETQSAGKGSLSHQDLANYLRDYLNEKYPDDGWMVIVYTDVYGGDKHTFRGYTTTVHDVFRQDGHNIVVGRLPNKNSKSPYYIKYLFNREFEPTDLHCTSDWWNGEECHMDSAATNENTWNNLKSTRLNPLMLHVASAWEGDGISLSRASSANLIDDGFAIAGKGSDYYVSLIGAAY